MIDSNSIHEVTQRAVAAAMHKLGRDRFRREDFITTPLEIMVPGLDRAFDGYRIVHFTDIHFGHWVSHERLEGIVSIINELRPDLVVNTGDFVSYVFDDLAQDMISSLRRIKAADGALAVLGNHDHWLEPERVREALRAGGFQVLDNDVVTISRGEANLHIAGVDDVIVCADRLDQVMEKMPETGPALILVHEPDFADETAATGRFFLQLSGHSHGLHVLNAGGSVGEEDNISGFIVERDGMLSPLVGSTQPLSQPDTGPAQIEFTPDGNVLVVTEKATNRIDTYVVGNNGLAGAPIVFDSEGNTPFGFAFGKRNRLFVSEAAGGAAGASSVSSYMVFPDGDLEVISAAVPTTETAACWLVVTKNGRYAYTTNTGSGSVSGYGINKDGSIFLLDPDGQTGITGPGPIDMALSNNSRFLYTLNSGNGTISGFQVKSSGQLIPLSIPIQATGLPVGVNGLAAR
jgi:predicted MPP superfamily phosphohydrolase